MGRENFLHKTMRLKRLGKKWFAILLVFFIVAVQLPDNLYAIYAANASMVTEFEIHWKTAEAPGTIDFTNNGSDATITPKTNNSTSAGTEITAEVDLSLTQAQIEANQLEIRLPAYIFKDRDGNKIGGYAIGLSSGEGQTSFKYSESLDTNELIVTNINKITDTRQLHFDITYKSCAKFEEVPTSIKSGYTNTVKGELSIKGTTPTDEIKRSTNELKLTHNISTTMEELTSEKHAKYETWQKEWGEKPTNAEDYFFVCWKIEGKNTQTSLRPFTLTFQEEPGTNNAVVGWYDTGFEVDKNPIYQGGGGISDGIVGHRTFKSTSSNTFTVDHTKGKEYESDNYRDNWYRTYVVVKYPRSILSTNKIVENKVTVTLTDRYANEEPAGAPQVKSTTARYEYVDINFTYPGFLYSTNKLAESYTEKGYLSLIKNNTVNASLPEMNTKWKNTSDVTGGILTIGENDTPNQVESYGKNPYSVEYVDDFVALENERLQKEDYSFTAVSINIAQYDVTLNEDTGQAGTIENKEYEKWTPVNLFYQTEIDGSWIQFGSIKKLGVEAGKIKLQYTDMANNTVELNGTALDRNIAIAIPEGAVGVKATQDTKYHRNYITMAVWTKLNATDRVKRLVEGKTDSQLTNVNSMRVFNHKGKWENVSANSSISGTLGTQIEARDDKVYSGQGYAQHRNASTTLSETSFSSDIEKSIDSWRNDTSKHGFNLKYKVIAYEKINSYYLDTFEDAVEEGFQEQREGTLYNLLPKGMSVDLSTIRIGGYKTTNTYYDNCDFTVDLVDNWKGSGRSMLIVKYTIKDAQTNRAQDLDAQGAPWSSGVLLYYNAFYPWESFADFGGITNASVAYITGNNTIADGFKDMPDGSFEDANVYTDLNEDNVYGPSSNAPKDTIYAAVKSNLSGEISSEIGYFKKVKNMQDTDYKANTIVTPGEDYSYRLSYQSSENIKVNGIILYDILENDAEDASGNLRPNWKGTLTGVDTSAAELKDVDAKVYYSIKEGISLNTQLGNLSGDANIDDATIWSMTPPSDMSTLKAVAVDMRKLKDGSDFYLPPKKSISTIVRMKAPTEGISEVVNQNAHAYNTAWIRTKSHEIIGGAVHDNLLQTLETSVNMKELALEIHKASDPGSGTLENPTDVLSNQSLKYDISISNQDLLSQKNITIEDVIPNGLTIQSNQIAWYQGSDSSTAQLVEGSDEVSVSIQGQSLLFTIKELKGSQSIHFIIPTVVDATTDEMNYVNTAKITKLDGSTYEKESETTYHKKKSELAKFSFRKTDKDNSTLSGAGFVLYTLNCNDNTHDHSQELISIDDSGNLSPTSTCWEQVAKKDSLLDGLVDFELLSTDKTYRLIEYQAPSGYVLPKGQWIISYDSTSSKFVVSGSIENPPAFQVSGNETPQLSVANYRPGEIPVTGSNGNGRYVLFGFGLMLAGVLFGFPRIRKKMQNL